MIAHSPSPPLRDARRQQAATMPGSPVTELVDYINDNMALLAQGTAEPVFSAQSGQFQQQDQRIEATVGPFTLRSIDYRMVPVRGAQFTRGYAARVRVHLASGREVSPEILFRLQSSAPAVVAMDRLCRVLHMVNHLEEGRDATDLWLHVGLSHILAVEHGHGRFFEDLLRRCGLGPQRIVLILPALPVTDPYFARLQQAYASYRGRGYRLALDLRAAMATDSPAIADALAPDWLRVHVDYLAQVREWALRPLVVRGAFSVSTAYNQQSEHDFLFEVPGGEAPDFLL